MSASNQNYAYIYGKKKPGAKENVISRGEIKQIERETAKLLGKEN